MKVISVLQPFASLIVTGAKIIETRSWATKYRGEILIHASAGKQYTKLPVSDPLCRHYIDLMDQNKIDPINKLPFGAIIGKVKIIDCIKTSDIQLMKDANTPLKVNGENAPKHFGQEFAFGDYTTGRYGWILSDPVKFDTPIPAKGKLGIWTTDL